jgi:hypothetical protein
MNYFRHILRREDDVREIPAPWENADGRTVFCRREYFNTARRNVFPSTIRQRMNGQKARREIGEVEIQGWQVVHATWSSHGDQTVVDVSYCKRQKATQGITAR